MSQIERMLINKKIIDLQQELKDAKHYIEMRDVRGWSEVGISFNAEAKYYFYLKKKIQDIPIVLEKLYAQEKSLLEKSK